MAADLFETYAVTAVAVMLLGGAHLQRAARGGDLPARAGGASILASLVGTFAVRSRSGNVERALYQGLIVSAVLAAAAFLPITNWLMDDLTSKSADLAPLSVSDLWLCSLIGLGVTGLIFVITDYYTSTRFRPVKTISQASVTGPRDQHHPGACPGPSVDRGAGAPDRGRHPRRERAGGRLRDRRGRHGAAVDDRADRRARRLRADHRQRRWHRRDGGPARGGEERHRPARRGRQHDQGRHQGLRDRLGRAGRPGPVRELAQELATSSRGRDVDQQSFDLQTPEVLIGLLIGGMMVYLFASLAVEAVGRAGGQVVEEVRRQFREKPGIMEGTERPDYARCVGIVTARPSAR